MMFRPLNKNVLIKLLGRDKKTFLSEGAVLMTGKGVRGIRSGDIVTFDDSKSKEVRLGKNKYLVINQNVIL